MKEKLGDGPLNRILMDLDIAIHHVLPDLWHHAEKPCKDGKFTLYDTELALELMQDFSAQGFILTLVVAIYVSALFRIIQVISRSNTLINVTLLGGRFWLGIPIFAIFLLWWRKKSRIAEII